MYQALSMRTLHLFLLSGFWFPAEVWAQSDTKATQYTFSGQLLFWTGALVIVSVMARFIFREQIHERRTLKRLINEIGPFYPEFDIDALKRWVFRCAPHVWRGWHTGNMDTLTDFATPTFLEDEAASKRSAVEQGHTRHTELGSVLKVHPLGLYMTGPGPAPKDVELMLRLELKGIDCVLNAEDELVRGAKKIRQIQHFWILRNDGEQWKVHRVWEAEEDATDLATRPQVPPIDQWSRPKLDSED